MRVSLTAIFLPPPHLARAGAQPERMAKEVSPDVIGAEIDTLIRAAISAELFAAGGCVNVVIQRAAVTVSE